MSRSAGTAIENNFSKGLITEATGLNFPENAATEAMDVIFGQTGQVRRRLGVDGEEYAEVAAPVTTSYENTDSVLVEYVWRAVARTGNFTFVVLQVGSLVRFYVVAAGVPLSVSRKSFAVNLADYSTLASGAIKDSPCQFASGNGRLFIVHPKCDPIVVVYDEDADTITQTAITIKIRDFEGIDDSLDIETQPPNLTNAHWYNLKNQGWWKDVRMVTPGGGAGPLTIGQ